MGTCHDVQYTGEVSSDGGPQMMYDVVLSCFLKWRVHHRLSIAYFPHFSCCAELAVETGKRLLHENMGVKGSLNMDKFMRTTMQYPNTLVTEASWSFTVSCDRKCSLVYVVVSWGYHNFSSALTSLCSKVKRERCFTSCLILRKMSYFDPYFCHPQI